MDIIVPIAITESMLTDSNVPETDYAIYSAATTYALGDRVIVIATHKIYESLIGSNLNNYPPTDVLITSPHWLEISATNRWRAFDGTLGRKTEGADSVTYQITPGRVVDSMAFLGMSAEQVQVVLTDPVFGVVYDETISLMTTTVDGWYSYFFSGIIVKTTECVFANIPPYVDATIDIIVTYPGNTARVGEIIIGLKTNIGGTQYRPSLGIHDYSIKETDDFGVSTFLERPYSKKMTCDVLIEAAMVDSIARLLPEYRITPIVWIGSDSYNAMIIYGKFNDFSVVIEYSSYSICSIEIEGLT